MVIRALPAQAILKPNESLSIRFRLYVKSPSSTSSELNQQQQQQQNDNINSDLIGKLVIKYVNWSEEEMVTYGSTMITCDEYLATKWKSLGQKRLNYLKLDIGIKSQELNVKQIQFKAQPNSNSSPQLATQVFSNIR